MRPSGSRVVVVSPELASGASGAGAAIPPNATLAFVIALKGVTPKERPIA
jgi:FKBP-type peptidyl-prolyl cis-trans isomerase